LFQVVPPQGFVCQRVSRYFLKGSSGFILDAFCGEVMAKDQDMEVILGDLRDKGYLGSILGPVDF